MALGSCRREGQVAGASEAPGGGRTMPQQQQKHWAGKPKAAAKLFCPSLSHLFLDHLSTRSLGCQKAKKELSIKVMEQFIVFRGRRTM
ncbi:hypothetical protein R1flu_005174 [Riccia fluitans]|uniref:Uncharacterized protein n=1 Tax=Riccia fluitans TaxID=41844 RepID=A0ABD1YSD9_9MARC